MSLVRSQWTQGSSIYWSYILWLRASLMQIWSFVYNYAKRSGNFWIPGNVSDVPSWQLAACIWSSAPAVVLNAVCRLLAVSCGAPKAPTNGGVLTSDYSVGTRVSYFCNDGYKLSSKELTSAICQPDGTWSNHNKIPRCSGWPHKRWLLLLIKLHWFKFH